MFDRIIFILLWAVIISCQSNKSQVQIEDPPVFENDSISVTPTNRFVVYGYEIDSSQYATGRIRWNQTLSVLLDDYYVSSEKISELARASRDVYDVRRLKAGKDYVLIHKGDSLKTALQFIFEPDERSYVIYNFSDSVYAKQVQLPVNIVEREISGVINSSLYETLMEANASPELVSKLVDVFAWQVDFFRINKGDRFKVIYEEEQVAGKSVGITKVIGAYFQHYGKDYYAIHFQGSEGIDYFDEQGNSLRKTFLRSPLKYFRRISSRYSGRRYHPVLKRYKAHLGTDYAAAPGTPIRTVGDGVVVEAKFQKYNGNYVKVRHNSNYTTQYLHMQKIKTGIRPGVKVSQGQTIGYVGSTGLANGPHVCFRFWKNGRQVDALKVDLPPSEPIDPSRLTSFLHVKNKIIHRLDLVEFQEPKVLLAKVSN